MAMVDCNPDIFGHGKIRVSTNTRKHIFAVVIDNTHCIKINTRIREKTPMNAFIIIYSNRLYCFQIYYFEIYGVKTYIIGLDRRVWEPRFPREKKIEKKRVMMSKGKVK
jgi:hypothetical protein